MSRKDKDIFESLIVGGILGASLGALISKSNRGESTVLGALAGAAILASVKANEDAKRTNIPLILEEDNVLYEVFPDGSKKIIKHLPVSRKRLPAKFTLK